MPFRLALGGIGIAAGPSIASSPPTICLSEDLRQATAQGSLDPAPIVPQNHPAASKGTKDLREDAWKHLESALVAVIYGSNTIETAGTNRRLTADIYRKILRGRGVEPMINDGDSEYEEHLGHLTKTQRACDSTGVAKSRREVINHTNALAFLIDRVVINGRRLSENLIRKAHQILQDSIDGHVGPGKYRDHEVAVSYSKPGGGRQRSICLRAQAVPQYMKLFVKYLDADIAAAEASGTVDPYTLAARYHHRFVIIHPFGDGNGRMSRLILNVLLLKYAGHVAPFGAGSDKEEYLEIVRPGQKIFSREDMEVRFGEHTSHLEFVHFGQIRGAPGGRVASDGCRAPSCWLRGWQACLKDATRGGSA